MAQANYPIHHDLFPKQKLNLGFFADVLVVSLRVFSVFLPDRLRSIEHAGPSAHIPPLFASTKIGRCTEVVWGALCESVVKIRTGLPITCDAPRSVSSHPHAPGCAIWSTMLSTALETCFPSGKRLQVLDNAYTWL